MRPTLLFLFLAVSLSPPAIRGQVVFNDGTAVSFGDSVAAVEQRLGEKALEADRGRPGVDRLIATPNALLNFDSDRLWRITLKGEHLYPKPIRLFSAEWMNPTPIDGRSLAPWMARADFDAYFAAWRRRADAAGQRENTDYWIKITESKSLGDRIVVTLPPRRRVMGTGRLIGNSWQVQFTGTTAARFNPKTPEGTLESVMLANEELSTLRRELPENRLPPRRTNGRPLAAAGVVGATITLDDGRGVAFGQTSPELKWLLAGAGEPAKPVTDALGETRFLVTPGASLGLVADRFCTITFGPQHTFAHPLRLFDAAWKNPDPVGEAQLKRGLTVAELETYIAAWRQRAVAAGRKENEDFWIGRLEAEGMASIVTVSLAPLRFDARGRSFWSDGFVAMIAANPAEPAAPLFLLTATSDAFNAAGRPPPGEPDPALAGVILEDGTELFFGQPQAEVERITGATAQSIPTLKPSAHSMPRIQLDDVGLMFSGGRLHAISYQGATETIAPFAEAWKNLTPIGNRKVFPGMTAEQFSAYLAAWEERAEALGFKRGTHYFLGKERADISEIIILTLPASRISPSGLNRPDRWSITFFPRGEAPNRTMRMTWLNAARGEFNATPPTPAEQRRKELKELARDQPKIEPALPAFTLPKF